MKERGKSQSADQKPVALVVGASSGVGLALATLWGAQGARVLGVGSRPHTAIPKPPFDKSCYAACDLRDGARAVAGITSLLDRQEVTRLDALFYCAGIGYYGTLETQSVESITGMTSVHVRCPVLLTRALRERLNGGRVVFISSVAAFAPSPDYAVYAASKAFLTSFARNLACEERGRLVVQCVHLGPVKTDFHQRSGVPAGKFREDRWDTAEQAAQKILARCTGSHHDVVFGMGPRILSALGRRLPELLTMVSRRTT